MELRLGALSNFTFASWWDIAQAWRVLDAMTSIKCLHLVFKGLDLLEQLLLCFPQVVDDRVALIFCLLHLLHLQFHLLKVLNIHFAMESWAWCIIVQRSFLISKSCIVGHLLLLLCSEGLSAIHTLELSFSWRDLRNLECTVNFWELGETSAGVVSLCVLLAHCFRQDLLGKLLDLPHQVHLIEGLIVGMCTICVNSLLFASGLKHDLISLGKILMDLW